MRRPLSICLVCVFVAGFVSPAADAGQPEAEARTILETAAVEGGLLVHLGCGDGTLTAALRQNDRWLVHGLNRDTAKVEKARRHIRSLGLYGKVSVDRLDGEHLPYADNIVNLLVADDPAGTDRSEMMRVLSPGGVLCLREDGAWTRTVKPRPKEMDEWSHFLHGSDNNAVSSDTLVGPPRHLQWVGGPRRARSHEYTPSISTAVSADGRVFYAADEAPIASVAAPPQWSLLARNAFSGVLLWRRRLEPWRGHLGSFHESPADLARRLVAADRRVYVTLGIGEPVRALDAATGETVRTYAGTGGAREFVHRDGTLFVVVGDPKRQREKARHAWSDIRITLRTLVALDAKTGQTEWSISDKIVPATLAVCDGRVFYQNPKTVVCLDAESGKNLWATERPGPAKRVHGDESPTLVVADGSVLVAEGTWDGSRLTALSAETGEKLWTGKTNQALSNAVDVFVIDGKVWTGLWARRFKEPFPPPYDLRTGKRLEKPGPLTFIGDQPAGHHHRCYRNKATVRWLLTARRGVEFIDVRSGRGYAHHWIRGTCQYGVMPANGLLYVPPQSCACYIQAQLEGFKALAADQAPLPESPARLRRGPAFEAIGDGEPAARGARDWPTYRGDPKRSGRARCDPPEDIAEAWATKLGRRISPPVVASGRVYAASVDGHTVHALDAADGRRLWSFTADGRVDSPPTVCGGAVVFGSADGHVYCLDAKAGRLAWRFRAAPADRRMVAWGGVESVWPVHGSALITAGAGGGGPVVWAAAGRSSHLSGGIRLCRLKLATGELISETRLDTTGPKVGIEPKEFSGPGIERACLPDVLSCDGKNVFMRHVRFNMKGERQFERRRDPGVGHLFSPVGFLDNSWWQRTYWVFGSRVSLSHGLSGWDREAKVKPFGRILAVDGRMVYGFGRDDLGGGYRGGHVGLKLKRGRSAKYRLFAADADAPIDPAAGRKEARKDSRKEIRWNPTWARSVPLLVRAMVLGEETLVIAGPPAGPVEELAAELAGEKGGLLQVVARKDGKMLAELKLARPPVFDGMAAAAGRLYLSGTDGTLRCFVEREQD